MKVRNFTFENEARWILIFNGILVMLGFFALLVVWIVRSIS